MAMLNNQRVYIYVYYNLEWGYFNIFTSMHDPRTLASHDWIFLSNGPSFLARQF